MTEVSFYHLETQTLEQVLPRLLQTTMDRGQRALVVCGTSEGLEALDEHLWTFADDSFLPHAPTGGDHDADQPVLLSLAPEAANDADVLLLVADADLSPDAMARFPRAVVLFGEARRDEARAGWGAVKDAGMDATYWKQAAGKWTKAG